MPFASSLRRVRVSGVSLSKRGGFRVSLTGYVQDLEGLIVKERYYTNGRL